MNNETLRDDLEFNTSARENQTRRPHGRSKFNPPRWQGTGFAPSAIARTQRAASQFSQWEHNAVSAAALGGTIGAALAGSHSIFESVA